MGAPTMTPAPTLGLLDPVDAYAICSVQACYDYEKAQEMYGNCCTGAHCDAAAGYCLTDDGCKYAYSESYTHTSVRRLDASLHTSRRLFDMCDDIAFVECMATHTGEYFNQSCSDHSHHASHSYSYSYSYSNSYSEDSADSY